MSDALRLIANIGGEEAALGQEPQAATTVARLWHLLFERGSVRLQGDARIERIACEALMEDPEGSAFPWLEGAGTIFAWLNTKAAAQEATAIGGSLAGADPEIGLVGKDHFLLIKTDGRDARLHSLRSKTPRVDVASKHPDLVREMSEVALGYFHLSKYIMYHNAPSRYGKD